MDHQTKLKTATAFAAPCLLALPAAYIAFKIRDASVKIRFTAGFLSSGFYLQIIQKYASPIVMNVLTTEAQRFHSLTWVYYHVIYYMIMSSSHTPFFGGNKYYKKHNITNSKQALIASIFPAQVYFHDTKHTEAKKSNQTNRPRCVCLFKETAKALGCFALTKFICDTIREHKLEKKITASPIIHMEVLALLVALNLPLHNIPSLILGMLFSDRLTVDVPYDFTYFVRSPREFWQRWSKPAAELYRYLIYEPLGARSNAIFATMSIFMVNAMTHVDYSKSLYGDKHLKQARNGWVKAFGVMGIAVALQINAEIKCPKSWRDSLWWKATWLGVLHGSMCCALWWIKDYSMIVSVPSMCASFK